jgi:HTH-type transcriptional regulator / antitoxin HigA
MTPIVLDTNIALYHLEGIALLKALMEDADLQPIDLVPILDNEAAVAEILASQKALTEQQISELAKFFRVPVDSLR